MPDVATSTATKAAAATPASNSGSSAAAVAAALAGRATLGTPTVTDKQVVLKHQNRELGVLVNRLKAEKKNLEMKVRKFEKRDESVDAVISCASRSWDQLLKDSSRLLMSLGIIASESELGAIAKTAQNGSSAKEDGGEETKTASRADLVASLLSSGLRSLSGNATVVLRRDRNALKGEESDDEEDSDDELVPPAAVDSEMQKRVKLTASTFGALAKAAMEWKNNSGDAAPQGAERAVVDMQGSLRSAEARAALLRDKLTASVDRERRMKHEHEDATNAKNLAERRLALALVQLKEQSAALVSSAAAAAEASARVGDKSSSSVASSAEVEALKRDLEEAKEIGALKEQQRKRLAEQHASVFEELKSFGDAVGDEAAKAKLLDANAEIVSLQASLMEARVAAKAATNGIETKTEELARATSSLRELRDTARKGLEEAMNARDKKEQEAREILEKVEAQLQSAKHDTEKLRARAKTSDELKVLLKASRERIQALETEVKALSAKAGESEEEALIQEIETLSGTLGDLEDQNQRLVSELADKESRYASSMQTQVKLRREISGLRGRR